MKVIPIGKTVLVELIHEPEKTETGLVRPDSGREKPVRGKVVGVQDGLEVSLGDQVLFQPFAGTEYKDGEKEMLLMQIDDILAKEVED